MNIFKKIYHEEIAHNKAVDGQIKKINTILEQENTLQSFEQALQQLPAEASIRFKNRFFWLLVLAYSVLTALFLLVFTERFILNDQAWVLAIPFVLFLGLFYFYRSDKPRKNAVDRALDVYEQLKYNFRNNQSQKALEHNEIMKGFSHSFKRGNHRNTIPRYASGVLSTPDLELEYTVLHYHYINKRKETYYEGTKRKERVVYDHFDRWGFFISGFPKIGFALTNYKNRVYKTKWDTSSIDFNKRHFITGANEIELAKLFQPSNIIAIEALLAGHKEFDLQVSDKLPVMYWGVNHNIFERSIDKSSLRTSGQLSDYVSSLTLPKLDKLLQNLQPFLSRVVN